MTTIPAEVAGSMILFVIAMIGLSVLSILTSVFLGLSIYNHAKSRNDSNAVMWAVLSALVVPIGVIIYAIVKATEKKPTQLCMHCGVAVPEGQAYCPHCQAQMPANPYTMEPADAPARKKKFKGFLIASIISFVVAIVLGIVGTVVFVFNMVEYSEQNGDNWVNGGYSDQFENYDGNNANPFPFS